MRKNNQNKKQNTIIAVLAVLLIGLLTVNLTYAFFTDRKTADQTLHFGKIEFSLGQTETASGHGEIIDIYNNENLDNSVLMPGSVLKTNFTISLAEGSQAAWLRFKLTASYDDAAIASELGGIETFSDARPTDATPVYVVLGETGYQVTKSGENYVVNTYNTNDSDWTGTVTTEVANKVIAYLTYLPAGVSYALNGTTVEVTLPSGLTQANAEKYSAMYKDLMTSLDLLNGAITKKANNATTSIYDEAAGSTTYWYVANDGYIYRNAETLAEDDVDVVFSYQVPFETSNVLQEHNVYFDLVVEAVQTINTKGDINTAANNVSGMTLGSAVSFNIDDDTNLTDDTLTIAADANTGAYQGIYYSARAFHAAVAAHGEIVAKY